MKYLGKRKHYLYNTLIANTNVTLLGYSERLYFSEGIYMLVTQRSYMMDIALDSVAIKGFTNASGYAHYNIFIQTNIFCTN